MKPELKQYQVEPDPFWQRAWMHGGGYDVMEKATSVRWEPIAGWGQDGWMLGSWPYVIIYFRTEDGTFDLMYYVEGDVTMYSCPTREIREAICDVLALFHWKHSGGGPENIDEYEDVSQLPLQYRGPYSRKRSN